MDIARLRPLRLSEASIPGGLALSSEAGWNQIDHDWRFMIASGSSFGYADPAGTLIASGLTVDFDRYAWISMILVTPRWQRLGLATQLMGDCVDALRGRGLVPALDASPQGREVYTKIGFRDGETLTRLLGDLTGVAILDGSATIRPLLAADLPAIAAFDTASSGADRSALLTHLSARSPLAAFVAERRGRLVGFVLAREGRQCAQIGPLIADDDETALRLLVSAGSALGKPACLDLFDHRPALRAFLDARGFRTLTRFIRMVHGSEEIFPAGHGVHIIAGPELS